MPDTPAQYLHEVGIFAGTGAPETRRFTAQPPRIDGDWMLFDDADGEPVFRAQATAVAFVRRHDKVEG